MARKFKTLFFRSITITFMPYKIFPYIEYFPRFKPSKSVMVGPELNIVFEIFNCFVCLYTGTGALSHSRIETSLCELASLRSASLAMKISDHRQIFSKISYFYLTFYLNCKKVWLYLALSVCLTYKACLFLKQKLIKF